MSLRFLSRHWQEPIGVADLAKAAALSRRGFQKAFTKQLGRSPGCELRRVRIEGAKKLLAGSNHEARIIAGMCGYKKVNTFHIAFKQATGLSPLQYRKSLTWQPPHLRLPAAGGSVRMSSTQVYAGWRLLGNDPDDIAFNLYRSANGVVARRLKARGVTDQFDGGGNFAFTNVLSPDEARSFHRLQLP